MAERAHLAELRAKAPGYADDYAAWVLHQVALLKARRGDELDFENLIDEVESLASSVYREFVSAIRLVLLHMLKWDHQSSHRMRSWQTSIAVHRVDIADLLDENPSFKAKQERAVAMAYRRARIEAAGETDLAEKTFPDDCPYDWDAIMTRAHRLPGDD
ncbi:MAG: DUF29 domain-containing protein [Sandarakinorhabdus sp.]|nr:DUF29 domain-containing protein [Sandarakinorhabdus sp.]